MSSVPSWYSGYSAASQLTGSLIQGWASRNAANMQIQGIQLQNAMGARNAAVQSQQLNSQWRVQRANASLSRAQAYADNTIREANNLIARSSADLTNWARSVSNNRLLEAAGNEQASAVSNALRSQEQQVSNSVESRLIAAEQRGALAASTALTGTLGSTMDALSNTLELRDQRRQFYQERQNGYANYDAMQQIIGIIPQAVGNMDTTVTQAGQDYGFSVGQSDPLPSIGPGFVPQQTGYVSGNAGTDVLSWFVNPANDTANRQLAGMVSNWFSDSNIHANASDNPFAAYGI